MLVRVKRFKLSGETEYDYLGIERDANGDISIVKVDEGDQAPSVLVENPGKLTDPKRQCASYEEAMFRNYQYFLSEMKFVMILPFHLNLSYDTIIDALEAKVDGKPVLTLMLK